MGLLVNGEWVDQWYETESNKGEFKRQESLFRNWITPDGAPGPTGEGGFAAEAGRYHLYVSLACPWAHRTLIFRSLKGLEDIISVSVVEPLMLERGYPEARLGDLVLEDGQSQSWIGSSLGLLETWRGRAAALSVEASVRGRPGTRVARLAVPALSRLDERTPGSRRRKLVC